MVDQLGCSSMVTACITIMQDQTCQDSCKLHSSSDTWHVYAMLSSLCLEQLVSVQHCSLSDIYTTQSSANEKLDDESSFVQ